jgi:glutamate--cysteine ligase
MAARGAALRAAGVLGRAAYDQDALDAAWDLARHWDAETREALARRGVGRRVASTGRRAVDARPGPGVLVIAEAGLRRRARPGAGGLIPTRRISSTR